MRLTKITCKYSYLLLISLTIFGCRRVKDTVNKPKVIKTKTGVEMVIIPGGWFEMGSNKGEPDELPVHRVWVSSFMMDRYEVPQDEFRKHKISDPSHFKNPKNPLEQINWTDTAMYCNDRSFAEGLEECYDEETWECNFRANGYRLPTEAEWKALSETRRDRRPAPKECCEAGRGIPAARIVGPPIVRATLPLTILVYPVMLSVFGA